MEMTLLEDQINELLLKLFKVEQERDELNRDNIKLMKALIEAENDIDELS